MNLKEPKKYMLTSYYFSKYLPNFKDQIVRISVSYPKNITWLKNTRVYTPLCPNWDLVSSYKSGKITDLEYTNIYVVQLNQLDPIKTYQELGENSILCCWEKPDKFCHRQIVTKWLYHHFKIIIYELDDKMIGK
jgi:hypothetical protein